VREHDDARRPRGHTEVPGERHAVGGDAHLLVDAPRGRRGDPTGGVVQQGHHLVVGGLTEVAVVVPDGEERLGLAEADHLVGLGEVAQRVRGTHGHREHHPLRAEPAGDDTRSARRRAGGDAVVDDDGGTAAEVDAGAAAAEPLHAGGEGLPFPHLDGGQLRLSDTRPLDDVTVKHPDPALADRAHGVFRLVGHAELADHDHVEGEAERAGDLVGHHHPAARQAEHHRVGAAEVLQPLGEPPPRLLTVGEDGRLVVVPRAHQVTSLRISWWRARSARAAWPVPP